MSRLIVVTGTLREAAVLGNRDMTVIAGGGDAEALHARLRAASPGAMGIVSFGFAGALADELAIGDWIIGTRVTGAIAAECNPAWSAALHRRLPTAQTGAIYADGRLITEVAEKRALGTRHAALGVDMESHIAAEVAAQCALPFVIVRCISDPVARALPPAIAVAMRPDGSVAGGAMANSLVTRPGQFADFISAIGGFMRAMASLREGARSLALPEALLPDS